MKQIINITLTKSVNAVKLVQIDWFPISRKAVFRYSDGSFTIDRSVMAYDSAKLLSKVFAVSIN